MASKPESRYEIILDGSDEDRAVIADIPKLPDCTADGETYEEALTNVRAVVDEWMDTARKLGREIPKPKGRLKYA